MLGTSLEDFSKRTAGVTALLLVLSVAYDFAYLHAAGLSFQALNTTVSDHLRSAMLWAPVVLLGGLLGALLGLGSPHREQAPGQRWSKRVGESLLFWSAFPLLAAVAIASSPPVSIAVTGLALGMLLIRYQPGKSNIDQRLGDGAAARIFLVPASLAIVSTLGALHGASLVASTTARAELTIRVGSEEKKVVATGLRRFSTDTLIATSEGIAVVPSDAVLTAVHARSDIRSLQCRLLERHCPQP
jgi:hypothetical protein